MLLQKKVKPVTEATPDQRERLIKERATLVLPADSKSAPLAAAVTKAEAVFTEAQASLANAREALRVLGIQRNKLATAQRVRREAIDSELWRLTPELVTEAIEQLQSLPVPQNLSNNARVEWLGLVNTAALALEELRFVSMTDSALERRVTAILANVPA